MKFKYTISGPITAEEKAEFVEYPDVERPKVRSDCEAGGSNANRPCPFVSCRHNNYLTVDENNGTIKLTWPGKEPEDVEPEASCSLDVAEMGQSPDNPMEFTELPKYLGYSRGAAQQLEERAKRHARQIVGRSARPNPRPEFEPNRKSEDMD